MSLTLDRQISRMKTQFYAFSLARVQLMKLEDRKCTLNKATIRMEQLWDVNQPCIIYLVRSLSKRSSRASAAILSAIKPQIDKLGGRLIAITHEFRTPNDLAAAREFLNFFNGELYADSYGECFRAAGIANIGGVLKHIQRLFFATGPIFDDFCREVPGPRKPNWSSKGTATLVISGSPARILLERRYNEDQPVVDILHVLHAPADVVEDALNTLGAGLGKPALQREGTAVSKHVVL